ncbi:hypothetical protein IFHNHDMJ_03230 [Synechococcus sp. CBW1107]|nr:hypothetical protein IFHNHDMJ_03230 [Synechococcus sp. CBW1107]
MMELLHESISRGASAKTIADRFGPCDSYADAMGIDGSI